MDFYSLWYDAENTIKNAASLLVVGIGIAGIFAAAFFSIFKIRKINSSLAILLSSVLSCFFMVPVVSAINNYVLTRVEGSVLDEGKAEIRAAKAEYLRLREENRIQELEEERLKHIITIAEQSIKIAGLNDSLNMLQNAGLKSTMSFQKILELALLQTELKQTMARKEDISVLQKGLGLQADYYRDEVLVVFTHDISAKFGVDLNEVKVIKLDGKGIEVSGIRSKFIGTSRNISDRVLNEVRRIDYRGNSPENLTVSRILVRNDDNNRRLATRHADNYERDFQIKLSEGLVLNFMDNAVVQLGQNFLKVMLVPIYGENISFVSQERPGALPLLAFLQKEIDDIQNQENESKNLIDASEEALESVLEEIETIRDRLAKTEA